jgi:hypothetical protein
LPVCSTGLTAVEWGWALLPGAIAVTLEMLRKRLAPNLFSAGQWQPLRPRRPAGA